MTKIGGLFGAQISKSFPNPRLLRRYHSLHKEDYQKLALSSSAKRHYSEPCTPVKHKGHSQLRFGLVAQ